MTRLPRHGAAPSMLRLLRHRPAVAPVGSVTLVVALLLALLGLLGDGAPVPATVDAVAVLDDFERDDWPDPVLWPYVTAGGWRASACQARRGARALRAFVPLQPDLAEPACDAPVSAGASSRALLLLDLRGAAAANRLELHFDLWLRLDRDAQGASSGLFAYLLLPDADEAGAPAGDLRRVGVFGATGDAGRWSFPGRVLDLRNLVDVNDPGTVYDLRGKRWWLEWVAAAPAGAGPGGGVFLDDLSLVWEPDAVVPTPTPRPLPPPSATPTASATAVPPTATDTPPPTREATATSPAVLFLPLLRRDPSPTPPPSATPAPASPTSAPGTGTPQPPSATPTPSATVTPSATPTKVRRYLPQVQLERSMEAYPPPPSFPSPEADRPSRSRPVLEWPLFGPP